MRIIPIAEVLEMDDGETVRATKGKVTAVYDRKEGTGEHGPWSFQAIELKDSSASIRLTLKNRDEMSKSWKGKMIIVSCSESSKHGFIGVKRKDDEYNKKIQRNLLATASAEIDIEQGGYESENPAPKRETIPTEPKPHANEPEPDKKEKAIIAFRKARIRGARCVVLHKLATEMALERKKEIKESHKYDVPDEMVQSFIATFFIELKGSIDIDSLPVSTPTAEEIKGKKPEPKEPPRKPETTEPEESDPDPW